MSPIYPIIADPLSQNIEQQNAVIHPVGDCQIAHQLFIAIDHSSKTSIFNLLSTDAQANVKQGRFDAACADSQKVIDIAPEDGAGYLELAIILSMACRHGDVIQACDNALQVAELSDDQHSLILAARASAVHMRQIRIDPFTKLPTEIADVIFSQLPWDSVINCLVVSSLWRERIGEYPYLWQNLRVSDDRDGIFITDAAASIAQNVQNLTLNTRDDNVRSVYLDLIKGGQFVKIKSLRMTECATGKLGQILIPLSLALQEARHTLSHLTIEQREINGSASLAQILAHCSTLTSLTYDTNYKLDKMAGAISDGSHPLVNLELISTSIMPHEIECILKECQQLRRLVVNQCDFPILDTIINYAPRLEILGYNTFRGYKVPPLRAIDTRTSSGLRVIHSHLPVDGISAVARFIHTYSDTLEVIDISTNKLVYASNVAIRTPDGLRFKNLSCLCIGLIFPIQQLILDGICDSMSLKNLSIFSIQDFWRLITILMELPPLRTLLISSFCSLRDNSPIPNMMAQLFRRYALLPDPVLRSVILDCSDLVSDDVLASLSEIQTLGIVKLIKLRRITSDGIKTFLEKCGNQLTKLKIFAIDVSEDSVIAIASFERLAYAELCSLQSITDQGIRQFVDKLSNNQLSELTVTGCPSVTEEGLRYAKKKVKVVRYSANEEYTSVHTLF